MLYQIQSKVEAPLLLPVTLAVSLAASAFFNSLSSLKA